MARRELSREELFALVWEKPTREIAKDFGLSDVAIGNLCARLQVPKPPRGYWARVQAGQTLRRPPLSERSLKPNAGRLRAKEQRNRFRNCNGSSIWRP